MLGTPEERVMSQRFLLPPDFDPSDKRSSPALLCRGSVNVIGVDHRLALTGHLAIRWEFATSPRVDSGDGGTSVMIDRSNLYLQSSSRFSAGVNGRWMVKAVLRGAAVASF